MTFLRPIIWTDLLAPALVGAAALALASGAVAQETAGAAAQETGSTAAPETTGALLPGESGSSSQAGTTPLGQAPSSPADSPVGLDLRGTTSALAPVPPSPGQLPQIRSGPTGGNRIPRRSRSRTALAVRTPTRAVLVGPRVRPEVQLPVATIPPEPAPPPAPVPRRILVEDDPYAPVGLKSGGLIIYPAIEQDVGYDTNPNRTSTNVKGSALLRTDGQLRVRSEWSTHELTADLRGSYSAYPNVEGADRPDGDGIVHLRLDAQRDLRVDLEGRYHIDTQRPGSPDLNAPVVERPLVVSGGTSAEVTKTFNRLSIGLRGSVDRTIYEDARLPGGGIVIQSDRDQTQLGMRLRAAYELTPGMTPFVDALIDTRIYDQTVDTSGFRRSSDGIGGRVGSTFEITRTITGEIAAGYQRRAYDDPRLRDLSGPLVDGALIWRVTPLTTLRLRAQSDISETTIVGSSGALTQRATIELQHDFRRNLSLIAALGVSNADYQGVRLTETGITGSLKLDYRLTRWLALRASYTHERYRTTSLNSNYSANVFLVGVRLQP